MHYIYLFKSSNKARQVTNSMTTYTQKATEQGAQETEDSQWPPFASSINLDKTVSQDLFPLPRTLFPKIYP